MAWSDYDDDVGMAVIYGVPGDPETWRRPAMGLGATAFPESYVGRPLHGLGFLETPGSKIALVAGLAAVGAGLWYFLKQSKKAKAKKARNRRRNRYFVETYGAGLVKYPSEVEARASAVRHAPKRGGWARIWHEDEPGQHMKLAGQYGTTRKGLVRKLNSGKQQLSASGWVASWSGFKPNTIYVDYEGKEFKRSQSVIRYGRGHYGWDFPEAVPADVKQKVRALFERLHRS